LNEILELLAEKKQTIDEYFFSETGEMHAVDFRYLLVELDMNLKFYKSDLE
jgi:hypothetical protein